MAKIIFTYNYQQTSDVRTKYRVHFCGHYRTKSDRVIKKKKIELN